MVKVNFPKMKRVSALMVDTDTGEILYKVNKEFPFHSGTSLFVNHVRKICDSLCRGLKEKNLSINISVEDVHYSQPFLFSD